MDTITKANLQAVLRRINEATGEAFTLDCWRPGDGTAYYRLEDSKGRHTFGERYCRGKHEAYWHMQAILAGLEYAALKLARGDA